MKLSATEDIEAPVDFVYRMLVNFDHWERAAMRRGADVLRTDTGADGAVAPGMSWQVGFAYRGRPRSLAIRLAAVEPGQALAFDGSATAVEGTMRLDVVEMGPRRTRVTVATEVRPRTLAARLFLQSLALARGRVTRRFQSRVAQFATEIADRFGRNPRG